MKRHFGIALCAAAAIGGMSALGMVQALAQGGAPATLYSVKELMDSVVDPSADAVWNAIGSIYDKDEGLKELIPKTPEEWAAVREASVRIAEGGNLLAMPGRGAAPAGTKSETPGVELEPSEIEAIIRGNRSAFEGFARALNAIGAELVRAADAKDATAILEIGARMENVCESCHQTFWYPPKH